ncbi:uncharacterized protein B0I36DRAFT_122960 [Microdochium trichocladiopsis]|uniref:Uncharacterized protein n=1 Tax=Microdochium trichocladiopsis TaxID=1682393 RepID=A0A9P8Y7A2_9PEZI|nr:uncharacterized protein B0I36DRAFT_122960 [Microdochium trichocladiopsis]KAH7031450.1 hypothetical protein B0I36DRAFT_122960 [Microdochium trichocladiopsis]
MALRPLMKRVWRSMSSTITPKPRSRTSGGHVRFHSHSNSNPSRGQHDKDSHNGHGRSRGGSISHVFRKHAASQAQSGGGTSGSGGSTSGRGGSTLDTWQLTNISEVELQRYDHVGRENVSHTAMCWSNAGEAVGERPLDDLETGEVDPQGLRQPGGAEHKDTGSRIQQRSSISIDLV